MSNFTSAVITEAGKSLIAKLQAEKGILIFTKIKTSDIKYTKAELYNLDDIQNVKQTRTINSVIYQSPNRIEIDLSLTNEDIIEEGYNLVTYGIFGKSDIHPTEILIAAVSSNDISKADWISPTGSLNAITINLKTLLIVSDVEVSEIIITKEGVTVDTFNEHVTSGGENSVHGSTPEPTAGAIVARREDGSAEIIYPVNPTNDSIVNKSALTEAVKSIEVPRSTIINYYTKDVEYKENDYVCIDTEEN